MMKAVLSLWYFVLIVMKGFTFLCFPFNDYASWLCVHLCFDIRVPTFLRKSLNAVKDLRGKQETCLD